MREPVTEAVALLSDRVGVGSGNPALVAGAAGGGLHGVDEWMDLGQVRRFVTALGNLPSDWPPRGD